MSTYRGLLSKYWANFSPVTRNACRSIGIDQNSDTIEPNGVNTMALYLNLYDNQPDPSRHWGLVSLIPYAAVPSEDVDWIPSLAYALGREMQRHVRGMSGGARDNQIRRAMKVLQEEDSMSAFFTHLHRLLRMLRPTVPGRPQEGLLFDLDRLDREIRARYVYREDFNIQQWNADFFRGLNHNSN